MTETRKRAPTVAANLLARPGGAPVRSTPVEDLPRPGQEVPETSPVPTREEPASGLREKGGIKQSTVGTTVYLLPKEHKRVRRLALDVDAPSVHELLLLGLDRLLAERGQPPIERYSPPRPKKG
jgi:hypothetical protein